MCVYQPMIVYIQLRGMVPEGMCVHVNPGKPRDQALEVFDHFNIQVTPSDIFTRCQVLSYVSLNYSYIVSFVSLDVQQQCLCFNRQG